MENINNAVQAMTAIRTVNLSLDNVGLAQDVVKAQKAQASEQANNWFNEALSTLDFEEIAGALTQAGQAMRQAGEFGSDDSKIKEGSRKSVASHNHERAMRFFTRTWKAVFAETYDVELSGSTIMVFKDLTIKAVKTWQDTITDTLKEQGLLSAHIGEIIADCNDRIARQASELASLVEQCKTDKEVADKEADSMKELAAAKAMSSLLGITLEEALDEISVRRAKQA